MTRPRQSKNEELADCKEWPYTFGRSFAPSQVIVAFFRHENLIQTPTHTRIQIAPLHLFPLGEGNKWLNAVDRRMMWRIRTKWGAHRLGMDSPARLFDTSIHWI